MAGGGKGCDSYQQKVHGTRHNQPYHPAHDITAGIRHNTDEEEGSGGDSIEMSSVPAARWW